MNFKLASSILHTVQIGDPDDICYVLYFSVNGNIVAASGSNNLIKIYNRKEKVLVNILKGHTDQIHETLLKDKTDGNAILLSCSSDKTVRIWDMYQASLVQTIHQQDEIFSIDLYQNFLVMGCSNKLVLYDLVKKSVIRTFDSSHTEDITRVRFHPNDPTKIVSVSMDGLICLYDLNQADDEEAIISVLNGEFPLSSFGFFGKNSEFIFTLSTQERLAIWDLASGTRLKEFGDLRQILTERFQKEINYFVNVDYHLESNNLFLFAGDYQGNIYIYLINQTTWELSEFSQLLNGHSDIVRNIYWDKNTLELISSSEDSKISFWQDSNQPTMEFKSSPRINIDENNNNNNNNSFGKQNPKSKNNKSNPY
ncbi:WD40 repeat-containing protein [Tieghemostelium lacteum]|uniref:WD40 repeat-containing protein n=1 Tax=Tieghemostelium lacteum TaxID=361077 RepID=A0A151ZD99_TIELA|nr:WD40 repeat-containing protein [Tieghemostelium lacteum]|eukprot:KYQ91926.1 WD40 repeat-containing protein [Tieghemostelium lacteum]